MNSKITIEVDFDNNNEPVFQIIYRPSDDVRDKLIKSFLERLGGDSEWCQIYCTGSVEETAVNYASQRWVIRAIHPKDIRTTGQTMLERLLPGEVRMADKG
jgi:hypothetical protein